MYLKFIPYTPTMNVSGRKKTENTVSTRMTSLVRCDASASWTLSSVLASSSSSSA